MQTRRLRRSITVFLFVLAVALGLLTLRQNGHLSTVGNCPPCPPGPHDCSLGGIWDTKGRPATHPVVQGDGPDR